MKLSELFESAMADAHLDAQETLMQKFSLGDHDAEDVLAFVLGDSDWEDLSDEAREKLNSHYQKTLPYGGSKDDSANPAEFTRTALKKELAL
jgi:hypothetical protein